MHFYSALLYYTRSLWGLNRSYTENRDENTNIYSEPTIIFIQRSSKEKWKTTDGTCLVVHEQWINMYSLYFVFGLIWTVFHQLVMRLILKGDNRHFEKIDHASSLLKLCHILNAWQKNNFVDRMYFRESIDDCWVSGYVSTPKLAPWHF